MAATRLTDEEVFGPQTTRRLTDAEVFGDAGAAAADDGSRTGWQVAKDLAASGLLGLTGVSKVPAMALDKAITGQWVGPGVEAISGFEDAVQEQKSPQLRAKERAMQERTTAAGKAAEQWAGGGDGAVPTTARMLAEFGTGAWESVKDPALLSAQLAQQVPMLGASRIGGLATGAAAKAAGAGARLTGAAAVGGAVGTGAALQGADIGTDAYQRLMALPAEQWAAVPGYKELAAEIGAEPAKSRMASGKAMTAAGQAAIASLLSTALPGGASVERALVGKGLTGKTALGAAGKAFVGEAVQEGVEEGFGAGAANEAVRGVDPTQRLSEGVGAAAGQGAALGGLMGGGAAGIQASRRMLEQTRGSSQPATPPTTDTGAIPAADVLGRVEPPSAAEQALTAEPTEMRPERIAAVPGAPTSFSTEAGARLEGQYALVEADQALASHDTELRANPAYPAELQPRDRTRAASEAQIASIVGKLDPARLGQSATAGDGAPIIGEDGLVESGNARTIALQRIYGANGQKAEDYKAWLRENAASFGLQPEAIDGMRKPMLVRVRTTPVNRAEFARQANASTVAAMSPLEQARADAARIDSMDDLRPDEQGEFATSRDFIRRFVGRLPATEQAGMIDAGGQLSSAGYARVRNAVLAKAYGDSPVLSRMVESMDDNLRNVSKALMLAAPRIAQTRAMIAAGRLHGADVTPDLLAAVSELSLIKEQGGSVADALAQRGLEGDRFTPETREILTFLQENLRSPRRIAEFLGSYADALEAAGDPNQGSLMGDAPAPTVADLLGAAKRAVAPAAAPAKPSGEAANDSPEWQAFGPETGTLGVPRSEMPQVRMTDRPALFEFLSGRGIAHETVTLDADALKPTQAEYSEEKTGRAAKLAPEDPANQVLVSSDGYIIDGHHRWLASSRDHGQVNAVRFDAPAGRVLDAMMQFPGTTVSRESAGAVTPDPRQLAVADLRDAVGELGDFLTRHMRAAFTEQDEQRVMPILVKIYDAAIRVVGTDLRRVMAWVRDHLRRNKDELPGWNKIPATVHRKAAEKALASLEDRGQQMGLFSESEQAQPDLFANAEAPAAQPAVDAVNAARPAPAEASKPEAKPEVATIDGRPYDMARDNFKPKLPPEFLTPQQLEQANQFVERYYKPPGAADIDPRARADAEAALAPLMQKAAEAKAEYDQKVIDVVRTTGALGQVLAQIKSMKRAAEKVALEYMGDASQIKDLLRATIVVKSYDDAPTVLDALRGAFDVVSVKDKTSPEARERNGGYADVAAFVRMPNGALADIQINTPAMLSIKEHLGHKLYEAARAMRSAEAAPVYAAMREIYDAAFANTGGLSLNVMPPRGAPARPGASPVGSSSEPSSENRIQRPSGNMTNSSPPKVGTNVQPSGNLPGTLIASTPPILPETTGKPYTAAEGGPRDDTADADDRKGDAGARASAAPAAEGGRQADAVPARDGGRDQQPGREGVRADAGSGEPAVQREGGDDARARRGSHGTRARRGAAVPAGRDIKPKSGLNYRFTDDDISPPGSWAKRAAANVEAVELVKQLQAEPGRQATTDEQRTLAKFVGWGASEIANNLFGKKLDKVGQAMSAYQRAVEVFDRRGNRPMRRDRYSGYVEGFYDAFQVLHAADPKIDYAYVTEITREQLDQAAPDKSTQRWLALRDRLKAALTADEYAEAQRSTQYGHYTSAGIVRGMWRAAERFGFKGGLVIEPGAGKGNFPGLMPDALAANSAYTGVEFDSITGAILGYLFPDEFVRVESYIDTKLPRDFYDLGIGNPPFAGLSVLADPEYKKHAFKLHDYFFAKTLDRVRPGGMLMFVTSRFTMDKLGDKARAYMAERADLVGAIRLPQTAFKQNAGTEVVTDVLFLRKKVPGEVFEHGQAWAKSVPVDVAGTPESLNEYYAAHPDMVLGTHSRAGSMYAKDEYTVLPPDGDIEALFAAAVDRLPADVMPAATGSAANAAQVRELDFNPKAKKEGNYYINDNGVVMQREGGVGRAVLGLSKDDEALIKSFVPLRDALKQAQYDQLNDGDWQTSLAALQAAYKAFTKAHGKINQFKMRETRIKVDVLDEHGEPTGTKEWGVEERPVYPLAVALRDDPEFTLVRSLENINDETGAITESDFLSKRVLGAPKVAQIATPHDAMLAVLNDTGKVDIAEIADRLDMEQGDVIAALGSAVYLNPQGGAWETADEYLSGDVGAKLRLAEAAAKTDRRYERNIEALRAAQPPAKSPANIDIAIGMNWIPGRVYEDFLRETAGVRSTVVWNDATRQWAVSFDTSKRGGKSSHQRDAATVEWGTSERHAGELLEHALTGRPIKITKTIGSGKDAKTVSDPAAMEAANAKLEALKAEFGKWVWRDTERTDFLVKTYNDQFNSIAPRTFDGRHLTLPGTSSLFNVFDHVKRGAWRIIQSGNTYLAHAVGSGKAQPLDAKLLTPTGWKLMGEIDVGDFVIAADGAPTMVEAVFPQGEKEIFRVEFSDGSATECCDEHLWLTQTYKERSAHQRAVRMGKRWPHGLPKVRSLAEIRETLVAPHLGAKNHSIPLVGPVQFSAKPLDIDAYVMGVLLGDGGMTGSSVTLSCADADILAQVSARLPAECELVHRSAYDYALVWRGQMRYQVGGGLVASHPVQNALRSLGLMGKPSHQKFIPDDYLFNTTEARIALLQGLMDTDGYVEAGGRSTRFTTTSRRLADGVTALARSLGGVVREREKAPTYTHKGERRFGRPAFDLCLTLPAWINPFRLPRKAGRVIPKSRYSPARYITAVVAVGRKVAQCIRVAHPSHLYVTDDFIVTHNTFEMVISAMEQKRLGLIKKPMMVVPNHMLQQFASEWLQLYPAARLMVADENAFHKDKRRQFVSRVALSDLDGVIITHSAFKLLDIDSEYRAKIVDEQLDFLRAALDQAEDEDGSDKGRKSPRVKQIEKRIETLEQKLKAAQKAEGKDQNARFDELGVDMLYVDEAHAYRKLDFGTSRQVKGISSEGSDQALDLYIKARWLEDKHPGRSLVLASGTPITNTVAELYSVMRFLGRQTLIDKGIEDFDSWAAMFGREKTALEANAAGKYEPVTRFSEFVNVPGLIQMFKQFADVLTADNLAAMLGDKRPKVQGGSRTIVVTPKTTRYRQFQRVLAARYEASRQWKPTKDEPNNPDPVIAIIGDGRLAAIDMRFINPSAPNDPASKLNRMIDGVIKAFNETKDLEYHDKKGKVEPNKGATMMVFSDLDFGEGVAANRGFNARAWMEKRLRDAGVPKSQVAFMSDYKKSSAKLALFKDVNAGRVRILVGSSKNMGTGVNAQQRLLDLFHLDSPWFPADLEQREGRIVRQGNKNKEVRIHAYAAKGSYDETMWGMLARKSFFIAQALEGDPNMDRIEDLDSMSQFDLAAAMVAEDPRVLQLAGIRAEIEKMNRLYQAHEDQRQKFRSRYLHVEREVAASREMLPRAEAAAAKVRDLSGDNFKAVADGKTHTERKAWGQAIKDAARHLASGVEKSKVIGEVSGFPVRFVSSRTDTSYFWHVMLETPAPVPLVTDGNEDPVQIALKAARAVSDTARLPAVLRDVVDRAEAERDALRGRLETAFPMRELLSGKQREAKALEAEIASSSADRPWRVERVDTGLGFEVMAHNEEAAIDKAMATNGGEPEFWRAIEAPPAAAGDTVLSRGLAGGIELKALQGVASRVAGRLKGVPKVHVLASPADAPAELRSFIEQRGATADAEGAFHDGEIYLFASGIADELRAEHVLAEHEAAHAGLAGLLGGSRDATMRVLYEANPRLRNQAEALIQRGLSLPEAVEEIIVDIPSAELVKLRGWRRFAQLVRDALQRGGFLRLAARIDRLLAGHLTEQQRGDLMVADLVREARAFVAGRRRTAAASAQVDSDAQLQWLAGQAKQRGFASLDELIERDYGTFDGLAALWRAQNPSPALMSRAKNRDAPVFDADSATVVADFRNDLPLKAHPDYRAAKAGDVQAAANVVRDLVKPASIEAARKAFGADVIYVAPHAEEAAGRNKIPNMLAAWYAARAGGSVDENIVQTNRAFHTGADAMGRLIARAEFGGEVQAGKRYVLVDDVTTMGGTLADLAAYIHARGGEVAGSVVLVNAMRSGKMLGEAKTIRTLEERHGDTIREQFGFEPAALTAEEARYLLGFRTADELRNRVAAARQARLDRLGAKGVRQDGADGDLTRLSRAGALPAHGARTTADRAEAIIQTAAGTPKPLDAFARTLTRITGLNRLTAASHGLGARLLDQITPERVKAGIVSDYGVPEAVVDRRALLQGHQREQLRQAGKLLEKLATMTRQESRVAYEWMSGDDTRTADEIMADLPAESVQVLREVRDLIDGLSQEAVRLGQLDPEAFKRHRFAYLRRSYFKHAQELTGQEKAARQRAISILGDQYKGRGIVEQADMAKIKNAAPEWWKRKTVEGKADTSLKGEKFERLERRAHRGAGTAAMEGMEGMGENTRPPKLLEVAYWPAGEPRPAKYAEWDAAGTFEATGTKGDKVTLWRDFTKPERERMGEIDEARFAIAKTLQRMIHDVEVGKYLEWLSQHHAKLPGEPIAGTVVEASERYRDTFTAGEWVQVPDSTIPGTSVKKYGKLAGQYLPGPIWNDLRQVVGGRFMPLGETYHHIQRMWKAAKTGLSPAVHTNNVMSNFVMADWHDVSAGHVSKALRIVLGASQQQGRGAIGRAGNIVGHLGVADREAAREILTRYENSGGAIGGWITQEIANEQLAPIVEQLQKELTTTARAAAPAEIGVYSALQHALHARFPQAWEAAKGSRPAQAVATEARSMLDLYQAEDDVFRLAAWLKAKEQGASDAEAGKAARRSFLDYSINAPWVQIMRGSALPFVSFTYRAVPMLIDTFAKRPHKIVKLMLVAAALNALFTAIGGGDDDDEARKLLPEEKAGKVWGLVPKLIRMPWNDANGSPVFLDIRRWIPVGDVFDVGQGHAALPVPPALMPGGPLVILGEILFNRSAFTGKPVTLDTDTVTERATKIVDHLWKAFAPNLLGLPGTYATSAVGDAVGGRTDAFGREQSVPQAVASSFGVKLGSYPPDVLRRNLEAKAKAELAELDRGIAALRRQRMTNRLDQDEFEAEVRAQQEKKRRVMEDLREKVD